MRVQAKGHKAYLGLNPDGDQFAVEAKTGAIIGDSIDQVREDVASADESIMDEQIEIAKKDREKVDIIDAEQFWNLRKR